MTLGYEAFFNPAAQAAMMGQRRAAYERRALAFLRETHAPEMALVSDDDGAAIIRDAYAAAYGLGCRDERDHLRFLIAVMHWGSGFLTDPRFSDRLAGLRRPGMPRISLARLIEELDRWQAAVASDMARPERRVAGFSDLYDTGDEALRADSAAGWMARLWPARWADMSGAAQGAFLRAAADSAARLGLSGCDAVAHGGLGLYFGYRFDLDPRFGWAARAYAEHGRAARRLALGQGVSAYWDGLLQGETA